MKKKFIILGSIAVILFAVLGYVSWATYKFVDRANRSHNTLIYLFATTTANGVEVNGFTQESLFAIRALQKLQALQATSTSK